MRKMSNETLRCIDIIELRHAELIKNRVGEARNQDPDHLGILSPIIAK